MYEIDTKELHIKIGSNSDGPIETINIYINGLPVSNSRGFKKGRVGGSRFTDEMEHDIHLNSGENIVKIEAIGEDGSTYENERVINVSDGSISAVMNRTDYAIIFATNDYDEWTDLINPVNDAREISRELKDKYGFEVELVENADKEAVLIKIREYATKSYLPNDQLFIFFAGHGHFDDVNGEGYIVAKDSKRNDPSFNTYISHNILRSRIDNIPSNHIFLTMDACFGGTFDPTIARAGSRGLDLYQEISTAELIERKLRYKTRQFLTSGGKVYVPDGAKGRNSPFAANLLEALRSDGGRDGLLTFSDLKGYVDVTDPQPRYGTFGDNQPGSSEFVFEKIN